VLNTTRVLRCSISSRLAIGIAARPACARGASCVRPPDRRDVIVSLRAVCAVLVPQRSEGLQRVGQLFDVLAFVPAAFAVVRNVAENPLRGILREFVAQNRFPVFDGPKHRSPLCFAARVGAAR
jgi:hypothetical protein